MENAQRISVNENSWLNSNARTKDGPTTYSTLKVSIDGSFVGLYMQ